MREKLRYELLWKLRSLRKVLIIPCLQRLMIHKPGQKAKIDPVRERIAKRAALEFKNGMYGILFCKKNKNISYLDGYTFISFIFLNFDSLL